MSETKNKNKQPKTKNSNSLPVDTAGIVEYKQKVQKSVSEDEISNAVIIDTEFQELETEWYDSIIITFKHKDDSITKCQFPISPNNKFIDENLRLLYNYLNNDPSEVEKSLVGETIPSMKIDGRWYVYIPKGFTKESYIMNKLLNSSLTSAQRPNPKVDKKINFAHIITAFIFGLSLLLNSPPIFVASAISFIGIFYLSRIQYSGELV